MAPLKIEDQMKQKLEQRRIEPSDSAWEKLSRQLDAESGRKKSFPFWWLGIAAGFIGVLLIVTVMVRSEDPIEEQQVVLEEETTTPLKPETQKEENVKNLAPDEDDIEQDQSTVGKGNTDSNEKSILNKKLRSEKSRIIKERTPEVLAQANQDSATTEDERIAEKDSNALNNDIPSAKAVAEVIPEESADELGDQEIDELLQEARLKLMLRSTNRVDIRAVDADALLLSVEDDLEESFRIRVFNALKSSYKSIKTAVAERNQ